MEFFSVQDGFSLDTVIVRAEDTLEAKKIMYQEYEKSMRGFGETPFSFSEYIEHNKPVAELLTNEGKGVVKRVIQYS